MARAVSLASIETQVRQRAQMENSTFITSAEMLSYINASGCELYELLVAARGKEYYLSSQTIVTTSGVSGYALATNFYEVVGIDLAVGGRSVTLQRYEFAERNRFQNPVVVPAFTPLVYGIEGTTLRLLPTPTSAQTVTVWYVPAPTLYTTTDSTFDGIAGWEEYIVVDCAIRCLQKQESDVSAFMAQKEQLRRRIQSMATMRDRSQAPRVTDVTIVDDVNWRTFLGRA
jgi:hypothetical protein